MGIRDDRIIDLHRDPFSKIATFADVQRHLRCPQAKSLEDRSPLDFSVLVQHRQLMGEAMEVSLETGVGCPVNLPNTRWGLPQFRESALREML